MTLSDRLLHSLFWRLYRSDAGIAVLRMVRWVVPRVFPYEPASSQLSELAVQPRFRVETRESSVGDAGRGLFAIVGIPAGEVLGEYSGDRITSLMKWLRVRDKDYIMTTDVPELSLDAARRPEMTMRYVNHHFDKERLNLIREAKGETVHYLTARAIVPGEELFVDYGDLYWKLRGITAASAADETIRRTPWNLLRDFASSLLRRRSGRMQLAIVIPLNDETSRYCHRIQTDIQREYGRNPGLDARPHITLKMGFPARETAAFEDFVEQVAAGTAPFDIELHDFGFFDEGILFLDVVPGSELERLRQRVLAGLLEQHGVRPEVVEGPQFHFHVTLAYGLAKPDFAALRKSFSKRELRLDFRASHIELFLHTGSEWETCKRAPLLGGSPTYPKPSHTQA